MLRRQASRHTPRLMMLGTKRAIMRRVPPFRLQSLFPSIPPRIPLPRSTILNEVIRHALWPLHGRWTLDTIYHAGLSAALSFVLRRVVMGR